ncbi:MAG: hypothetical protein GXP62_07195 [Oligoflexia bacterium]|nr:hypothetical protein [Oligoflexia bacterium]
MPVSSPRAAQRFAEYSDKAHALAGRFRLASQRVAELAQAAQAEVDKASAALAVAYLGGLSPAALSQAEQLTGFRGFSRRDPLKAMARERQVLEQTVARIAADERYQRREYLVGPAGERTLKLAECKSLLEPWEADCAFFEREEGFLELVEVGYDTPAFLERFWESPYWKHWAAGDRICEALDMPDFGDDVLPAYRKVEAERTKWRAQVAQAEAAVDQIHELVQQHDQAAARIPRLQAVYLEGCQGVLAKHLRHADPQLLAQWLPKDAEHRPQRMALRRMAGATAKLGYLNEINSQALQSAVMDFSSRAAKYNRKSAKYNRPKRRYLELPDSVLDSSFDGKIPRYQQRADKLQALAERIGRFDNYSAFDLSNDPELWWVHITGKRPPSQLSTTRRWYDRHPNLSPIRDQIDPGPAVATAVASRQLDDADYLS